MLGGRDLRVPSQHVPLLCHVCSQLPALPPQTMLDAILHCCMGSLFYFCCIQGIKCSRCSECCAISGLLLASPHSLCVGVGGVGMGLALAGFTHPPKFMENWRKGFPKPRNHGDMSPSPTSSNPQNCKTALQWKTKEISKQYLPARSIMLVFWSSCS